MQIDMKYKQVYTIIPSVATHGTGCVKPPSSHGLTDNLSISSFDPAASFKVPRPKPQAAYKSDADLENLGPYQVPNLWRFLVMSWSRPCEAYDKKTQHTWGFRQRGILWGFPKPWVSILKWFNFDILGDLSNLRYRYLGTPYLKIHIHSAFLGRTSPFWAPEYSMT